MKNYAAAAADADECIKLEPSFAKGYYRKAQACEKLRDWGPAYDAYKGCLERTKKGKEYDRMQKASEECYKKVCKQMREGKVSVDTSAILLNFFTFPLTDSIFTEETAPPLPEEINA